MSRCTNFRPSFNTFVLRVLLLYFCFSLYPQTFLSSLASSQRGEKPSPSGPSYNISRLPRTFLTCLSAPRDSRGTGLFTQQTNLWSWWRTRESASSSGERTRSSIIINTESPREVRRAYPCERVRKSCLVRVISICVFSA